MNDSNVVDEKNITIELMMITMVIMICGKGKEEAKMWRKWDRVQHKKSECKE